MIIITAYIKGKTDHTSRTLRRRLTESKLIFDEQSPSKRPFPGTILNVNATPYSTEEIKTRDMLWKAIHLPPSEIDLAQAPLFCPDQEEELTEDDINEKVAGLISGGEDAVQQYFKSLPRNQQAAFIIAIRLQRHADAHLLGEFSDMVSAWLTNKSKTLDPYMGWKPKCDERIYMWWME